MNPPLKDSGTQARFASGMVRDSAEGKPRFDLLLPLSLPFSKQFLTRCARHLERGGPAKYGERNWEQANSRAELERFKASALRHVMQWACGETDEDHAAAAFFNIMAAEYVKDRLNANGE